MRMHRIPNAPLAAIKCGIPANTSQPAKNHVESRDHSLLYADVDVGKKYVVTTIDKTFGSDII